MAALSCGCVRQACNCSRDTSSRALAAAALQGYHDGQPLVMVPMDAAARPPSAAFQDRSYSYVGCGAGVEQVPTKRCSINWWIVLGVVMLLCAVVLLLLLVVPLPTLTSKSTSTSSTTVLFYDCNVPLDAQHSWSANQRQYCCSRVGIGCESSATPPSTPTPPIATKAAANAAALVAATPVAAASSVTAAAATAVVSTSMPATPVAQVAPVTLPPTTPAPKPVAQATVAPPMYDCHSDMEHWARWRSHKKSWCCQHTGKGCAPPPPASHTPHHSAHETSSLPFDCSAGFSNWQKGWSVGKKSWCCQNENKGCMPPPVGPPR
mmetsp:Transcript_40508/g.101766  ORF Transcript_40508/g.101766 Transcript_40508/m.101766 type:complete len:321 (-) Transcript_40508:183-1145(-)